ncbi:MAG TPA: large conductance mechanosensitive channel protein MscL [Phycisphaerales bacterium]|nr:large conductance mechanosensitive channel protein MscL [Phycisphaerales bacterium]
MGMVKEFKEFALKGNMLDLAVAVIIGGAFGGIVKSLIDDVIMPPVGLALGKVDFKNLYYPLSDKVAAGLDLEAARKAGPVVAYGNFITVTINFIILAFIIFLVVKAFNTAKKRFEAQKPAAAPAGPTAEQKLLTEIRDLLAKR